MSSVTATTASSPSLAVLERFSALRILPVIVIDDPANTVFYACGPNALVDAAEHLVLGELQLPKDQLRLEKWG